MYARVWAHWNHSFNTGLSYLGLDSCFHILSFSGLTKGVAKVRWLLEGRYSSFLSALRIHQLTFHGGWNCWWLWHHLSTDMAGNVPFLMSEAECGWEPEENFVFHKWNSMKGSSKWFRIYFKEWKRTREMFNSKISKNANNLSFCFHLGSLLCKRNCSLVFVLCCLKNNV